MSWENCQNTNISPQFNLIDTTYSSEFHADFFLFYFFFLGGGGGGGGGGGVMFTNLKQCKQTTGPKVSYWAWKCIVRGQKSTVPCYIILSILCKWQINKPRFILQYIRYTINIYLKANQSKFYIEIVINIMHEAQKQRPVTQWSGCDTGFPDLI